MPRWQVIALVALLLGCSSEGLLLESRAAAAPSGREVLVPRPADSFVDSVGLTILIETQADADITREALLALGVRHARSFAPAPVAVDLVAGVVAPDIGLHLVADPRLYGAPSELPALAARLVTLESVEGPNDHDANDIDLSAEQVTTTMRELRGVLDGLERPVPLVDGLASLVTGVGDLSEILDYGNFERGRSDSLPGRSLELDKDHARTVCGSRPLFVSECGYITLPGAPGAVSESVMARYIPRLLLAHFAQGIERTFVDELRDGPDPSMSFMTQGLIAFDGARKPAFFSLERLLARTIDAGPAFATTPLEVRLDASASSVQRVLLARRDGTRLLLVWNEVASVDEADASNVAPEPVPVTVDLVAPTSYALYRPWLSADVIESGRSAQLSLLVPDDVLIVELSLE